MELEKKLEALRKKHEKVFLICDEIIFKVYQHFIIVLSLNVHDYEIVIGKK